MKYMNNGLLDALKVAGCADLPKPIDNAYKKTWIKAIVKVRKYNGTESYCLAVNDGSGETRIIRDFGSTAIIAEVVSIHPYVEAPAQNIIPHFVNDEQRVKYLHKFGYNDAKIEALLSEDGKSFDQVENDRAIVNSYIEIAAIKHAKKLANIEEETNEFRAVADPKLKQKRTKENKYGKTAPRKAKGDQSKN